MHIGLETVSINDDGNSSICESGSRISSAIKLIIKYIINYIIQYVLLNVISVLRRSKDATTSIRPCIAACRLLLTSRRLEAHNVVMICMWHHVRRVAYCVHRRRRRHYHNPQSGKTRQQPFALTREEPKMPPSRKGENGSGLKGILRSG